MSVRTAAHRDGSGAFKASRCVHHRRCTRGEPFHYGCRRLWELRRGSAGSAWLRRVLGAEPLHVETRSARCIGQSIGIRPVAVVLGVLEIPPEPSTSPADFGQAGDQIVKAIPEDQGRGTPLHDWAPGPAARACSMHWSRREIYPIACVGPQPGLRNTHEPSRRSAGPSSCQQSRPRGGPRQVCSSRVAFSVLSWPRPGQK